MTLVPPDFTIPTPPHTGDLWLEQLRESHNESDLAAWGASIEQIRVTPGMTGRSWPPDVPYTLEENASDMRGHEADFAARTGFTYTVLDPAARDVIGCVYIYPPKDGEGNGPVAVRSWVRSDKAHLDGELYRLVLDWLISEWPWTAEEIFYASR